MRLVARYTSPIRRIVVPPTALIAACAVYGTQTRHLARIFTIDFRKKQALNSFGEFPGSANRVG
jgi:hypothetical protein